MIGENRQLVTNEQVEFEKSPVEVQDYCRKITDHFRRIYRTYPKLIKENRRMSTCNRSDLQTLGSQPVIMPEISPITDTKGSLHTWTKSRDHELVRAQRKWVSKGGRPIDL